MAGFGTGHGFVRISCGDPISRWRSSTVEDHASAATHMHASSILLVIVFDIVGSGVASRRWRSYSFSRSRRTSLVVRPTRSSTARWRLILARTGIVLFPENVLVSAVALLLLFALFLVRRTATICLCAICPLTVHTHVVRWQLIPRTPHRRPTLVSIMFPARGTIGFFRVISIVCRIPAVGRLCRSGLLRFAEHGLGSCRVRSCRVG